MLDVLYEAFERFSIMTIDGGLSDSAALKKVKEQYGDDVAVAINKMIGGK